MLPPTSAMPVRCGRAVLPLALAVILLPVWLVVLAEENKELPVAAPAPLPATVCLRVGHALNRWYNPPIVCRRLLAPPQQLQTRTT